MEPCHRPRRRRARFWTYLDGCQRFGKTDSMAGRDAGGVIGGSEARRAARARWHKATDRGRSAVDRRNRKDDRGTRGERVPSRCRLAMGLAFLAAPLFG